MKRELAAVYDEMVRRQKAGEKSIFLSDEAVELLKKVSNETPVAAPESPVSDDWYATSTSKCLPARA